MHPKFAAIAVDAVVAYSCMTDSAWVFAWTLQEVQALTTDHDLCLLRLPSIPSSPWLLSISRASWHIPLGSQQWWQDHLHIGPPREHQPETHLTRPPAQWCLQHNDEEQGTEYGSLMDPDLYLKLIRSNIAHLEKVKSINKCMGIQAFTPCINRKKCNKLLVFTCSSRLRWLEVYLR